MPIIPFMSKPFGEGISVEIMLTGDFLKIQEWITQRNTEKRATKSTVYANLSVLKKPHLIVAIGELTEDDEDENGNFYPAGTRFVLDANTRKYYWEKGKTDQLPDNVLAIIYKEPTLVGLRAHYYAYDNPDAVEQASEVMTGIYKLFDFIPKSNKIIGGSIVTAQNYASMWTPGAPLFATNKGIWGVDPDPNETKTTAKRWAMAEQFKFWRAEWEYLDIFKIGTKGSVIDQPLLMALLITSRVYKHKPVFEDLVRKLNRKDYNAAEKTAIAKIGEAAIGAENDVDRKTEGSFESYINAFNFYLYWIERYMKDSKQHNCAAPKGGYIGKGKEWIDKYFTLEYNVENALTEALNV